MTGKIVADRRKLYTQKGENYWVSVPPPLPFIGQNDSAISISIPILLLLLLLLHTAVQIIAQPIHQHLLCFIIFFPYFSYSSGDSLLLEISSNTTMWFCQVGILCSQKIIEVKKLGHSYSSFCMGYHWIFEINHQIFVFLYIFVLLLHICGAAIIFLRVMYILNSRNFA